MTLTFSASLPWIVCFIGLALYRFLGKDQRTIRLAEIAFAIGLFVALSAGGKAFHL